MNMFKDDGKAAIVVTNNSLFEEDASETRWTRTLWAYDLRTTFHMTLKTNNLKKSEFDEFIKLYNPHVINKRKVKKGKKANADGPVIVLTK